MMLCGSNTALISVRGRPAARSGRRCPQLMQSAQPQVIRLSQIPHSHGSSRYRSSLAARAAEEETAARADGAFPDATPLEQARQALDQDPIDRDTLASSLDTMEAEMDRLRLAVQAAESRAQTAEAANATTKDQLLRLGADFDNYRRRTAADSLAQKDSVRGDVIMMLLPIVDNFELARKQVKAETEQEQKINNSYQGLYKQFVDVFRSLGVEAVPTVGTPFDPSIHEAIMRAPSSEYPDDTVTLEFRKGFRIGDKLLRPATVQVSYAESVPEVQQDTHESDK